MALACRKAGLEALFLLFLAGSSSLLFSSCSPLEALISSGHTSKMPGRAPFPVRLVLLLYTALLVSQSTATCFYPNGDEAPDDVQCEPGDDSACCGKGAICLDNGLCLSQEQPFGISRGSCTDSKFDTGKCTQHCTDVQMETGVAIVLYNVTETNDILYCCNSIVNRPEEEFPACDSGEPFTIQSGKFMPGVALLEGYVKASDANNSSSSDTDSNSSDTNTTSCPDTNDTQDAGSSNNDVAIGAGVGVPLGVIALVSIAWALYERSQRKKLLQPIPPTITTVGPFPAENKPWAHHELPSANQVTAELPSPPVDR